MMDYFLSLSVARLSGAQPNDCFCNAWEALYRWLHEGFYVEGWAAIEFDDEIQVVEHGWCTLLDNTIVDPTIPFLDGSITYFSGIEYSHDETAALELLPHVRFTTFGEDGMAHEGYKAAYENALTLAQSTGKRVVIQTAIMKG